jgi:putative transposase
MKAYQLHVHADHFAAPETLDLFVAYAVWAYHWFSLSTADTEDLLAERGVIVSREAVRLWVNHFGRHFADCIRRDRPRPNHKRHMDEVVISIRGKKP